MLSLEPREVLSKISKMGVSARFMEVCGTHTVSIARSGLKKLLPDSVKLISGPGCPVCVTAQVDIDYAIALARQPGVIVATFGDMVRVPGTETSLLEARASGGKVEVVYSPMDSLNLARAHPKEEVVFLAVGFETTAPLIARTVQTAKAENIPNLSFLVLHKLIPPAMRALLALKEIQLDGFILPGHVSAILGSKPFLFLKEEFHLPGVITGFEPDDILLALFMLVKQKREDRADIEIQYRRAVRPEGNPQALKVMEEVFEPQEANWRGLGIIPESGLALRQPYWDFDARRRFPLKIMGSREYPACGCGEVLRGVISPQECPLFGRVCTPDSPVGPCMVSSEGSCAAAYHYEEHP
ncbi:MAG: hydrogenase formation protein HypD [Coprothermobacterota bacterium]|nr:hydrogenase formation protein HypD [Coprothermobacterota bacterium]